VNQKKPDILMIEGLYSPVQKRMIEWTYEEIKPLLVYRTKDGADVPFFTNLLVAPLQHNDRFLCGLCTGYNPARKREWKEWANKLFTRGCFLSTVHKTSVKYNLPQIDVWITLPYPRAGQNDFGFIDNQPLSFLKQEDRKKAIIWWIHYIIGGFEKYVIGKWKVDTSAPRLRLRGFVWGRDSISDCDNELVSHCNDSIRRLQLESLWLTNYGTASLTEWKKLGFNHVSIFSNYTGKTVYGVSLLQNTIRFALINKTGVQMICGKGPRFDTKHFTEYLNQKIIYIKNSGPGPVIYRFPNHSLYQLYKKQSDLYHQVFQSLHNPPD
jgi:hypothetical protein